jgi:hypothetical protein
MSWGPSWEKKLPGEQPRETAEALQTSFQPSRHFQRNCATSLSGAEEQTARAIGTFAQYVCFLYLQVGLPF